MKFELWIAFVLGAVLSWGAYVPVLHEGQTALGEGKPGAGAVRAFICVGLAYLITAVIIPLFLIFSGVAGEPLQFNARGFSFATLGGIAGAAGALCIILSLKAGGKPLYVAPLVFAGAPIVASIVSLIWHWKGQPGTLFYLGIVLAAVGAGMVLYSKGQLDQAAAQKHAKQLKPAAEAAGTRT
jgi:uncharacterized membrane protein